MKAIFWFFADDVIEGYVLANSSLQLLSKKYPVYALCSGNRVPSLTERISSAKIITTENRILLKARTLFNVLKNKDDYDVLIKVDADSVIFDSDWLLDLVKEHIEPMTVIGTARRGQIRGGYYIRGGCQATHKTLVDAVRLPPHPREKVGRFDFPFNKSVIKAGGILKSVPLLEVSDRYEKTCPVWHPPKKVVSERTKFKKFGEMIRLYESGKF